MESIPLPRNSIYARPRIPYFCATEYDRGDFLSYPDRAGWSNDEINSPFTWAYLDRKGYRTCGEATSFLQNWIFFGVLDVLFGSVASWDEFIDIDTLGAKFVHTRNLAEVAQRASNGPPRDEHLVCKCISSACDVHRALMVSSPLDPDFVVSLGLFLHVLPQFYSPLVNLSMSTRILWPRVPAQPWTENISNNRQTVSYFGSVLMHHGWCPCHVARLDTMLLQYVCMFLEPPHADKDHSECTIAKCVALHVGKSTYLHKHTTEGCECNHLTVNADAVKAILKDGGIPVVEASAHGTDDMGRSTYQHLTVKSTNDIGHRYVAISHVWSDGLGNPAQNSMASCQVRRISQLVSQLPGWDAGATYFWIDTLCCPVEPRDMRHLAIIRMRQTYQEASSVLVLDRSLQKLSHRNMGLLELAAHISCSTWMSRLWTWQEGSLPPVCYIQFADGVITFEELVDRARDAQQSAHELGFFAFREIITLHWNARRWSIMSGEAGTTQIQLSQIPDALKGRSTSVPEDEAVCIGALMNCDLPRILSADGAKNRMRALWETCPSIPRRILFWSLSRLPHPGFRWAPATFLNLDKGMYIDQSDMMHTAMVKPCGLQASSSGFMFQSGLDHPVGSSFWISDSSGHWLWAVVGKPETPDGAYERPALDDDTSHYMQLALLVDRKVDGQLVEKSAHVTLVYVYAQKNGVIYGRRSNTAYMYCDNHTHKDRWPAVEYLRNTLMDPENAAVKRDGMNVSLNGTYHVLEGHLVGEDQQWCID